MGINLKKLEKEIDDILAKETKKSLEDFLSSCRTKKKQDKIGTWSIPVRNEK